MFAIRLRRISSMKTMVGLSMTSLVSSPRMITLEKQAQVGRWPRMVHHRLLVVETAGECQAFSLGRSMLGCRFNGFSIDAQHFWIFCQIFFHLDGAAISSVVDRDKGT